MSSIDKTLPLRPNVCVLIFRDNGDLLIGERSNRPGVWQFPQGGIEPGDSAEESVYREVEEELGIERQNLRIVCKLTSQNDYEFRDPPEYARGRWRGQSQSFWVVRFLGKDSDVRVDTEHPEFSSWRWAPAHSVLAEIEPIRRAGCEPAVSEFLELLSKGYLSSEDFS